MVMDEYEYDEGSDIDNWETEQVYRDREWDDHVSRGSGYVRAVTRAVFYGTFRETGRRVDSAALDLAWERVVEAVWLLDTSGPYPEWLQRAIREVEAVSCD